MAFGWKVCSIDEETNSLWSAFELIKSVHYIYGQFVFPPRHFHHHYRKESSPLAVFKSRQSAIKFCNQMKQQDNNCIILPCEYIPSKKIPFWAYGADGNKKLPKGTVFADAVRIF